MGEFIRVVKYVQFYHFSECGTHVKLHSFSVLLFSVCFGMDRLTQFSVAASWAYVSAHLCFGSLKVGGEGGMLRVAHRRRLAVVGSEAAAGDSQAY